MVGSIVTNLTNISGPFGTAEMLKSPHEKLILLDVNTSKVKVADQIYRSIILKRNRSKVTKGPE